MSVAFVIGSSSNNAQAAATSYSNILALTAVGGVSHVLVIACGFNGNPGAFTTQTWNAIPVLQVGSTVNNGAGEYIAFFYLLNPAAGNNTWHLVWTNSVESTHCGAEFSGVNTSTPVTNFTSAIGTSANPAVTIPTTPGDAIMDLAVTTSNYFSTTQTHISDSAGVANGYMCAYGLAVGTSVTDTWTVFSSVPWVDAGVAIKQSSSLVLLQSQVCM